MSTLRAWAPAHAGQADLRADYLAHLASRPDGLSRSCRPDHLTASALIVDPADRRVLLTLHRTVRRWLQTGGHCEPGDTTLASAAAREAVEESGIPDLRVEPAPLLLSRHPAPCRGSRAQHLDVQFLAVAPPDAIERRSEESVALEWFPAHALPRDTDDSVRELVAAALVRLRGRPGQASASQGSPAVADTPSR